MPAFAGMMLAVVALSLFPAGGYTASEIVLAKKFLLGIIPFVLYPT